MKFPVHSEIETNATERQKAGKKQPKKPSGFSRKQTMEIEEATAWDHPTVLSILRFKVPVLLFLRLVSHVSCR